MTKIADNLILIRQRILAASKAANRKEASIDLIAVSKGTTENQIREAIKAGQNIFGENRVQEAKTKFEAIRKLHPPLKLHLIGSLQTNKAEEAVKLFDVIQVLDRPKLADALSLAMKKTGLKPKLYIEVNIGGELQKAGVMPSEFQMFLKYCRDSACLTIDGLMCIPPKDLDPGSHFEQLRILAEKNDIKHLSMGMSADFETAIAFGATEVRVGTAIFGERKKLED